MRNKRETGAALLTALLIAMATALLLSASLYVTLAANKLGFNQTYSETALQLANAGINSELQYISINSGQTNVANRSSQPIIYGNNSIIGRQGTLNGNSYYVYSSKDAAGTIPWDSFSSPFYITSKAVVNNCWQAVQVTAKKTSAFNVCGIFGLCDDNKTITVNSGSTVTITGTSAVNGGVSQSGTLTAPNCLNANTSHCSNQFTSSNSSNISTCENPVVYPKTTDVLKTCLGQTGSSTNTIWNNCSNSVVYEYKDSSSNFTLSPSNCVQYQKQPSTLINSCWSGIHQKPFNSQGLGGYDKKIQTMIFEPGDYYFTSIQLAYDATKELLIDPCAYASGGTPGQVSFWVYDPNYLTDGNPADIIQQPIRVTCVSGSTPDPGLFRIYYAKDNCSLTFQRPANILDASGNTYNGDFNYYCGFWGVSKQPNDTTGAAGTCLNLIGNSKSWQGGVNLCGSVLADRLAFTGVCKVTYTQSVSTANDPYDTCQTISWSKL